MDMTVLRNSVEDPGEGEKGLERLSMDKRQEKRGETQSLKKPYPSLQKVAAGSSVLLSKKD